MSKKATPANSAAAKRAAFSSQRQQFAAKGKAKSFGPTVSERRIAKAELTQWGSAVHGAYLAI